MNSDNNKSGYYVSQTEFGAILVQSREQMGLTHEQVAEALEIPLEEVLAHEQGRGITTPTVSRYVSFYRLPKVLKKTVLAEAPKRRHAVPIPRGKRFPTLDELIASHDFDPLQLDQDANGMADPQQDRPKSQEAPRPE